MPYYQNQNLGKRNNAKSFLPTVLLSLLLISLVILSGCDNILSDTSTNRNINGEKIFFDSGVLYYMPTISKSEAENVNKYLDEDGICGDNDLEFVLDKNEDVYVISFVVGNINIESTDGIVFWGERFSGSLSNNVFNNAKVDIQLCDDNLNVLYKIPGIEAISKKIINGGILYYSTAISQAQLESIGDALIKMEYFYGKEYTAYIIKDGDTYELSIICIEEVTQDEEVIEIYEDIREQIAKNIFNDNKFNIILRDEYLNILKEI